LFLGRFEIAHCSANHGCKRREQHAGATMDTIAHMNIDAARLAQREELRQFEHE
jgi:hypothetical protein